MYPNLYRTRGLPRTLSANTKGFFNGLIGQKKPENDTEMIQNYRRYRHTSGNGRKERTNACLLYTSIARALNEYGTPYNALSVEIRAAISDLAALKFEVLRKVGDAVGNIQTYQL